MTGSPLNQTPPYGSGSERLPTKSIPTGPGSPPETVSKRFIVAYFLAQAGEWVAILTPVILTIALRINNISDPAEKAAQLGLILGIGAFGALVAAPVWGQISDRTRFKFGRRKIWMVVGILGMGLSLLALSLTTSVLAFGIFWFFAQVFHNANQAALNALLPDQVPPARRGRVSGLLGLTTVVGALGGTLLVQFLIFSPVLSFMVPWAVAAVTTGFLLTSFKDRPAAEGHFTRFGFREFMSTFWVNPLRFPDFGWAWGSRFFVIMGAAYLQTYTVYLFSDNLNIPEQQIPQLVLINSLIGAVCTLIVSPLSGLLSDKIGRRKPFVFIAAAIGAAGFLVIGFAETLPMFFIGSVISAVGIGVYYAIDLALVAAVLPDPENSAKDMGVFQIANSLPQSLAPAIAPLFLSIGGIATGNYLAVFIAASVFLLIGAFAILPVRGTK